MIDQVFEVNASEAVGSDLLACPSQRKLTYLEDRVYAENRSVYRLTFLYNLATMLLLNSEPIVFQAFPAADGWPFPVHLGSCGRFVAQEHVGSTLAKWLPQVTELSLNSACCDRVLRSATRFQIRLTKSLIKDDIGLLPSFS